VSVSSTYLDRWRAEREQQRRREQLAEQQLTRIRQQRDLERQRQARDEALRAQVLDALLIRKRNERKQEAQEKEQHQAILVETLQTQREQKKQHSPKQPDTARLVPQQRVRPRDAQIPATRAPDRDRRTKVQSAVSPRKDKDRVRKQEQDNLRLKSKQATLASQQNKKRKEYDLRWKSVADVRTAAKQEVAMRKRDSDLVHKRRMASREKQLRRLAESRISPAELPPRALPSSKRLADVRPSAALPSTTSKAAARPQPGTPLPDDSPLSWLSTQGGFVVDENGNAVYLRGVTVTGLDTVKPAADQTLAQALSLDDVGLAVLANGWGVNLIRLPFTSSSILSGNIALTPEGLLQGIDDLIAEAESAGCYVLLALKPGREATGILPSDDDYLCMQSLARRYRDQPAVLYEPFASTSLLADNWLGIAQAVIGTIRREHQGSLLFMGNGKGTAGVEGLPLIFTSGDPIYNLVYTLRLAPSVMNTVKRESLQTLSHDYPLFVSEWSDSGPDFGRSSAFAADLIGRVGAGWAAANWNTEPSLVISAGAHKFSATRWGMIVQRALAQPVRPLLIPYSPSTSPGS
jgi:hypothetical protein